MLVGIGKGGFIGRFANAEMNQFSEATAEAIADLAEGIGMSELAEQHRDQLRPAAEAFGAPFGRVLFDQRREFRAGKMLEELIEETGDLYDGLAFLVGGV